MSAIASQFPGSAVFAETQPNLDIFRRHKCPQSFDQLEAAIRASGCVDVEGPLTNLKLAIRRMPDFFTILLPFLWGEAQSAQESLTPRPLLDTPEVLTLTQRKCLVILANALFCTFANRKSDNCVSGPGLPSINFDELYGGYGSQSVARAKLLMILAYFDGMRQRCALGDLLARKISFERYRAERAVCQDWLACDAPLIAPFLQPGGRSIDEAKQAIRVDFANQILGGAAIAYGCVQEEIMFCLRPELIAGRLYCTRMRDDEAILIRGVEQFSLPDGYGSDLAFGGTYEDRSGLDASGMLRSSILAVDAYDLRGQQKDVQYGSATILRELNKLWAALPYVSLPAEVATGNWGCGVFGGDVELKFLIQWVATSRAGKTMLYFPWDEEAIIERAPVVMEMLLKRRATVGACVNFLMERLKPRNVFTQLEVF
jgi:poly(ADP-ribose) glycohydrolase